MLVFQNLQLSTIRTISVCFMTMLYIRFRLPTAIFFLLIYTTRVNLVNFDVYIVDHWQLYMFCPNLLAYCLIKRHISILHLHTILTISIK